MIILYVIITIIIVYCIAACVCMASGASESKNIPDGTVGIVLGCTVRNNEPTPMLKRRCDRGLRFLNENKNSFLILSGGRESEENRSEAQTMYDYMTQKGADRSRLILENKSATTVENMLFSKKILEEKGCGSKAVIITTDFHMFRSRILAKRAGIEPYALCSHLTASAFLKNVVRELIVMPVILKK